MIVVTEEQLAFIMPSAKRKADIAEALTDSMNRFGIDTRDEVAAFIANLAHESGEYRWMQEIWGPTSEQLTYERDFSKPWGPQLRQGDRNFKAYTLGNDEPGDGRKFSGHGPVQITGKTNHVIMGFVLELDLLEDPLALTDIYIGTAAAAAFWYNNNLDDKVKQGFVRVVRAINGGTNGLADRKKYLERCLRVIQ